MLRLVPVLIVLSKIIFNCLPEVVEIKSFGIFTAVSITIPKSFKFNFIEKG